MAFASTHARRLLVLVGCSLPLLAPTPAAASKPLRGGSVSVGVLGSYDILQLQDVNSLIDTYNAENGTRLNDLNSGLGALGEFRYALSRRVSIGAELGYFAGSTDDPVQGQRVEVSGVPLAVTVGWTVHEEHNLGVRLLAGLGYLFDGTFRLVGDREVKESDFLFQVGAELEWRPKTAIGLSLQGLARQANVQRPAGFLTDLDFSGGTVRVGLRGYWGGRDE